MKKLLFLLVFISSIASAQLVEYARHDVSFVISDTMFNNTLFHRKAVMWNMNYKSNLEDGHPFLTVIWKVKHYADSLGQFGSYLGWMVPDKTKEITADNTTFVDPTYGYFIYPDSSGNYSDTIKRMGQYDFFQKLADSSAIEVDPTLIYYGGRADWNDLK